LTNNESNFSVLLGDRVKKERYIRGWSQYDLADKAGISPGHISMIENGQTKQLQIKTVRCLADALGLTIAQLLGEE